jgi:hypothetical protein
MAWGDAFYRKAAAKVEERTGEQVDVIGWASRPGAMASVIRSEAIKGLEAAGGGGTTGGVAAPRGHMTAADGGKGAKLPMSFLVALTPTALRVFAFRKTWFGVKLKKQLGELPRDGLELQTQDTGVVRRFHLAAADGSALVFEMNRVKWTKRFTEQLSTALSSNRD